VWVDFALSYCLWVHFNPYSKIPSLFLFWELFLYFIIYLKINQILYLLIPLDKVKSVSPIIRFVTSHGSYIWWHFPPRFPKGYCQIWSPTTLKVKIFLFHLPMESLHQKNFNWSFWFWSACLVLILVFIETFSVVGEQRRIH